MTEEKMPAFLTRTVMLVGKEAVEKLQQAHVAVFGVGGVGGHGAEALVRSGIGALTLFDGDLVAESNLNRQIFALRSTIGLPKTEAAALRLRDINPDCRITTIQRFLLPEDVEALDLYGFDYVLDAIDTVSTKLALIKKCDREGIPMISAMGAGNKLDPTRFEVADIYKTSVCPLAAAIRRECRKAGVKGLKVVYSKEEAITPHFQPPAEVDGTGASRRLTPASCGFVPSVSGLIMAGEIVKDLCAGVK